MIDLDISLFFWQFFLVNKSSEMHFFHAHDPLSLILYLEAWWETEVWKEVFREKFFMTKMAEGH